MENDWGSISVQAKSALEKRYIHKVKKYFLDVYHQTRTGVAYYCGHRGEDAR